MAGKLFEYVIVFHPRRPKAAKPGAEDEDTGESKILIDLTRVIARDEKAVGMMAAKKIPDEYDSKLDQVEILIRPF